MEKLEKLEGYFDDIEWVYIISPSSFRIYEALLRHAENGVAKGLSNADLRISTGVGRDRLRRLLKELDDYDWISIERDSGFGNVYTINPVPEITDELVKEAERIRQKRENIVR